MRFSPPRPGPLADAREFGVRADGTTDNTAAVLRALQAFNTRGGGTLVLPEGVTRCDGQLLFPNDGGGTPRQPPIRLVGCGSRHMGQATTLTGGAVLDLRYSGAGVAKILTKGLGFLALENLILKDDGASTVPFLMTTNTTLHLTSVSFEGNGGKVGRTCDQDAVILGGTSAVLGGGDDAPFQGYGTVITGCTFRRIRRAVYFRTFANGINVQNCWMTHDCGSNLVGGCAIELKGDPEAGLCSGNNITNNCLEVGAYDYGIKLQDSIHNILIGNGMFDATAGHAAAYRMEDNATYNLIVPGFGDDVYPTLSDASGNSNTLLTMHQAQETNLPNPVRFRDARVYFENAGSQGPTIRDSLGGEWFQALVAAGQASFYHQPSGGSPEEMLRLQRVSATDKRVILPGSVQNVLQSLSRLRLWSADGEELWIGSPSGQFYVLNGVPHFTNGCYVGAASFPAPSAGDDGKFLRYNHGSNTFTWETP